MVQGNEKLINKSIRKWVNSYHVNKGKGHTIKVMDLIQ